MWSLGEGEGALVQDSVDGSYGQVYDDLQPAESWSISADDCTPTPPVVDTGFILETGDTASTHTGLDSADTDTDLPTGCVQVTAKVDGATVFDAGFDFASLQSLSYPGWVAYPVVYFANGSFSSMNAQADNLQISDLVGHSIVIDDFQTHQIGKWRAASLIAPART